MGELLRRYWMPIAAVAELDDQPTKPVRLMGEDLVLYRDGSGTYGLIDRHCPHRRADLSYGFVEECGLRCNYHGWLFDETGRCTRAALRGDRRTRTRGSRTASRSRPTRSRRRPGCSGPTSGRSRRRCVPDWEPFTWKNGFVQIVFSEIPCNWFQCQENSIDPVHFEWLHSNWSRDLRGQTDGPRPPTHLKIGFDEFEYGFIYRRIREGTVRGRRAVDGRPRLPLAELPVHRRPLRVARADRRREHAERRLVLRPRAQEMEPFEQERIPYWYAPIKDEQTGRWITSHVMNQDFMAWVGQGTSPTAPWSTWARATAA